MDGGWFKACTGLVKGEEGWCRSGAGLVQGWCRAGVVLMDYFRARLELEQTSYRAGAGADIKLLAV
jgi:hypothetical protein